MRQAAWLGELALGGKNGFGAFTLCFTQVDTASAQRKEKMTEFVDHLCKSLGMAKDSPTLKHVCTPSNPDGEPDKGTLLQFFGSLVSDT
jgi:hypothetical protein